MGKDNTWYVAITQFGSFYSACVGAGGKSYEHFKEIVKKQGIDVIAEQFGVTSEVINRISDGIVDGKRIKNIPLNVLVERLRAGENFDVQKALVELCSAA